MGQMMKVESDEEKEGEFSVWTDVGNKRCSSPNPDYTDLNIF